MAPFSDAWCESVQSGCDFQENHQIKQRDIAMTLGVRKERLHHFTELQKKLSQLSPTTFDEFNEETQENRSPSRIVEKGMISS